MMRRRRLRAWTLAVLVLFLGTSTTPRAISYVHHHAGGDLDHVHPWGADVAAHQHDDDDDDHPHHHHRSGHREAGLWEPDGDDLDHVHWQAPFQQATQAAAPHLVRATIVRPLTTTLLLPDGWRPALPTQARAPPLPAVR